MTFILNMYVYLFFWACSPELNIIAKTHVKLHATQAHAKARSSLKISAK